MLGATPKSHYNLQCYGERMRSRASDHTGTPTGAGGPQSIPPIETNRRRAPNGLAFRCRKRAARDHVKIATISREAVSWYAVLGGDLADAKLRQLHALVGPQGWRN